MIDDEARRGGDGFNLTVLAVLGWILPLAGFAWGPGEWWHYVLWLSVGTALIVLYETTRGGGGSAER